MRLKVEFELQISECSSDTRVDEITEWLKYGLVGGSIDIANPLSEFDIIADGTTLDWQKLHDL